MTKVGELDNFRREIRRDRATMQFERSLKSIWLEHLAIEPETEEQMSELIDLTSDCEKMIVQELIKIWGQNLTIKFDRKNKYFILNPHLGALKVFV